MAELTAAAGWTSLVGRWAVTCKCKSCVSPPASQQCTFPILEILTARPCCVLSLEAIITSDREFQKNFLTKSYCKNPFWLIIEKSHPHKEVRNILYCHICLLPLCYKTFLILVILFWGKIGVMADYSDDAKNPGITWTTTQLIDKLCVKDLCKSLELWKHT